MVKLYLLAVCELFWGLFKIVGKSGVGVEENWSLRKYIQWSPSIIVAKCGRLRRTEETCRASCICISFSRSRCRAVVPETCLRVCMCLCYGVGRKLQQTGVLYTSAGKYIHVERCYRHYGIYLWPYSPHHVVYICIRVCALCLFVLSRLSTTCVCIIVFLNTCMCVWEGIGCGFF